MGRGALISSLKGNSLEMAPGGENMMGYVVPDTEWLSDPWKEACVVWGSMTCMNGWDKHRLCSPPPGP